MSDKEADVVATIEKLLRGQLALVRIVQSQTSILEALRRYLVRSDVRAAIASAGITVPPAEDLLRLEQVVRDNNKLVAADIQLIEAMLKAKKPAAPAEDTVH